MTATAAHPAPHRHRANLWLLLFGLAAAPTFWIGQIMLGYAISALACFQGDHPDAKAWAAGLKGVFTVFDAVAILAALAAGVTSFLLWRAVRAESEGRQTQTLEIGEGRTRFMAMWGLLSSALFLAAILFNTIASSTVPTCTP